MGKADIIISGGSEACINPAGVGGFNALKRFPQEMMILKRLHDHLMLTVKVLFWEKVQVQLLLKN